MSFMQAVLIGGLVTGIGVIMFSLIGYITDLMYEPWFSYLAYIILFVGIVYGSKLVREKCNNGSLSYAQGLGAGTLISVITGILSGLFTIMLFKVIDPDITNRIIEIQTEKMLERGMAEEQIEMAMEMSKNFMNPVLMMFYAIIGHSFFGFIFSLITSAIVKKEPVVNLFTETEE